jgi:Mycothiol maleylpyruvate isomerase N-terminal domain
VSDLETAAVLDALDAVYGTVTSVVTDLADADLMRPTRCAGWAVADVLYHQLLDARRALRTFATPSAGLADRDEVTYWDGWTASSEDSAAHARPWGPEPAGSRCSPSGRSGRRPCRWPLAEWRS